MRNCKETITEIDKLAKSERSKADLKKVNNFWLCIINKENLEIIEKKKIYGIPDNPRAIKYFEHFNEGDVLIFYVINPVKRIVGLSKVASPIFTDEEKNIWLDRVYPHRVKISKVKPFVVRSKDFLGKISSVGKRIPMGCSIIPISQDDFEMLEKIFDGGVSTRGKVTTEK